MAIVPLFWVGGGGLYSAGDNKVRMCMVRELVMERWEQAWVGEGGRNGRRG